MKANRRQGLFLSAVSGSRSSSPRVRFDRCECGSRAGNGARPAVALANSYPCVWSWEGRTPRYSRFFCIILILFCAGANVRTNGNKSFI